MAKTMVQPKKNTGRASKTNGSKVARHGVKVTPRTARIATPVYDRHIEVSQDMRGGKPRIAGRRITVEDIVAMHLFHSQSIQYIIENYRLSPAQVYAALTYYYDHRIEIDQSLADGVTQYEREKSTHTSLLARKQLQS